MARLEIDVALERAGFRLEVRETLDITGVTAIFGPSGSGKTTLLRVIAGLEHAATGLVRFRDEEWLGPRGRLPAESRAIGYVFQDGRLFSHLDVRGNLLFPVRHGRRRGPITFADTVDALDLGTLLSRYPASLSGGEIQRVAVARALLAAPAMLLMDEPLSSLDLARKRELLPVIRSLPKRFGLPVLYVTHDIDELAYLADRVVLLAGGRNVASGSPSEILALGDFARLSELTDPGNILEATIESQAGELTVAVLDAGRLRIPKLRGEPGETVRLRIDPRDVILAIAEPAGLSIRNRLAATVTAVESRDDGLVTIRLDAAKQVLSALVTRDAVHELELAPGRQVHALIKSVALDAIGVA